MLQKLLSAGVGQDLQEFPCKDRCPVGPFRQCPRRGVFNRLVDKNQAERLGGLNGCLGRNQRGSAAVVLG
jgi:hypothetical protein